jgi:hypothetical protein
VYNFCEYIMTFLIFTLSRNGARRNDVFNGFPFSSANPTFINDRFITRSCIENFVTQSRTGLEIYEGHDDQLNRPGPMA